jgi:hypothetical protein
MEFKMHKSGLHYYDPRKEHHLYKTLSYPYMKNFKWVIQRNHIKYFPVTIQDIDAATKI